MRNLLLPVLSVFLAAGCGPAGETAPGSRFQVPSHFPEPAYNLQNNPVTLEGVELGKALFTDPILSLDSSVSCAGCHRPGSGFADRGRALSHGIGGRPGLRNAPPLQNLAWGSAFFWDGGVGDLDFVPIAPIENPDEMDNRLDRILDGLRRSPKYPALFQRAYGSTEITSARFLKALSQFMLTLVSADARYDRFRRQQGETLTTDERAGLLVFKQKCASCHAGELFTDRSYRNNGLAAREGDEGRARITGRKADRFAFRVPSLRNVAVTGPYMHDGRFETLAAVLEHYAERVRDAPNLDPLLRSGGRPGIALTEEEKRQIIAFLNTLTDSAFLQNSRLAEGPD